MSGASLTPQHAHAIPRADIPRLEAVVADFAQRFDGAVSANEIYQLVFETYTTLCRDATVLDHLVPLAAHVVGERLRERVGRPRSR